MNVVRILVGLGLAVALIAGAGCQSPAATTVQSAVESPPSTDRVGLQLSEARLEQQRLDRELTKLRDELYRTAVALKQIKDRLEAVAVLSVTNTARIVSLEGQLRDARVRATEGAAAEAGALRLALERERENQARLRALADEREKEVSDLRAAMRAQEDVLRRSPKPAAVPARPAPTPATPPTPAPAPAPAAPRSATPAAEPAATTATNVYRLVVEGQRALKAGDLARARARFEEARSRDPNLAGAMLGLAAIAYQVDDLKEARRLVDEMLAADGKNAQALGLRGLIRWREGSARDGERDCARAVELDPTDPLLQKFHGITLNARGRNEDAVRAMRRAVELDPTDNEAKVNLAILLATASKPDLAQARKYYDEALAAGAERDPALDKLLENKTP